MVEIPRLQRSLSSLRREVVYMTASECPASLMAALATFNPERSLEAWLRLLDRGSIYVNGKRTFIDGPLPVPCRIELFDPVADAPPVPKVLDPEWIIYRDEDLAIIWKPPGISTMPAREQRLENFKALIDTYLGTTAHIPSRLDTSTQGLVPVSLSSRMNRTVQRMFERRAIKKHYLALVSPPPTWDTMTLDASIARNPAHSVLRQVVQNGGQEAITNFIVRTRTDSSALLSVYPQTGRTHQIRVHCQHLNIPIIGDDFYGGTPADGLHLIAFELSFFHAYQARDLRIQVPVKLLPEWAQSCREVTG